MKLFISDMNVSLQSEYFMSHMYILIKKYPTFQFKSIPLTTMNGFYPFLTNDKYVYKTGNHY